jgi:hypothetical protein
MVANSSRVRWRERKAAALKKRVRQLPPEVRCTVRESGRGQAVGGEDEVPRAEYDETDRKESGESSHLLFDETRLPLGEPGHVRRYEVLL